MRSPVGTFTFCLSDWGKTVARSFIVVEPDQIVRLDLEGMLRAQFPEAGLTYGRSLADVGNAINASTPSTTIFVRWDSARDSKIALDALHTAAVRGCQIIMIGANRDVPFPATFIDPPFTTEMVIEALDRVARE